MQQEQSVESPATSGTCTKREKDAPYDVYFISAPSLDLIKIGKATCVKTRFRHLGTSCPVDLVLLGHYPETYGVCEKTLHRLFKKDRARGEWFKPSPELLAIAACKTHREAHMKVFGHLYQ